MSAAFIGLLVKALGSGGRNAGIPVLAVAEGLAGLVSQRLAQSIADVRIALQDKTDAEAKTAEAVARIKVARAVEAENRATDERRHAAENRLLEAQAAKTEAEARVADAQASRIEAESQLIGERAKRVALANENLVRAVRVLKAKDGDMIVDVEALHRLLSPPAESEQDAEVLNPPGAAPPSS